MPPIPPAAVRDGSGTAVQTKRSYTKSAAFFRPVELTTYVVRVLRYKLRAKKVMSMQKKSHVHAKKKRGLIRKKAMSMEKGPASYVRMYVWDLHLWAGLCCSLYSNLSCTFHMAKYEKNQCTWDLHFVWDLHLWAGLCCFFRFRPYYVRTSSQKKKRGLRTRT